MYIIGQTEVSKLNPNETMSTKIWSGTLFPAVLDPPENNHRIGSYNGLINGNYNLYYGIRGR